MDRDNEIELIETIQKKDKVEHLVVLNFMLLREVK